MFVVLVGEEVTQQHLHEAQRVVGPVGVLPFRRRVARPMREHLRVYTDSGVTMGWLLRLMTGAHWW